MPFDFRIEARAGPDIGLGHVVRCAHLANELARQGATVVLCSPDELAVEYWGSLVDDRVTVAWPDLLHAANAVVLDFMDCSSERSRDVVSGGMRLVTIVGNGWTVTDEVRDLSDLVVYQSYVPVPGALSGVENVILAPAYADEGHRSTKKTVDVLLAFGGGIPLEHTFKVARALLMALPGARLVVVVGGHSDRFGLRWRELGARVRLVRRPHGLADLQAASRLYVGSLGMMAYETAALGAVPFLVGRGVEHVETAERLAATGAAFSLGLAGEVPPEFIAEYVAFFEGNEALMADYRERGQRLVDGLGAGRVAKCLMKLL